MSKHRNHPRPPHHKQQNQLRIIGGQWRGRKLPIPQLEGLRPTTDRVRETLFNWLATEIPGARCLDLFAGSGALGLEALSRGASFSCFIDTATPAIQQIDSNLALLDCNTAATYPMAATQWLKQFDGSSQQAFDIIFIDAPFGKNLVAECLQLIDQQSLLSSNSLVYLETNRDEATPAIPEQWQLHREKTAGQVSYRLYRINPP